MDQLKKLLSSLAPRQLLAIVIAALAVAGGMTWFSRWQRESGLRPLYTNLSAEDANAIVTKLHEAGVDYRVADNGASLLVPEDRVPELRLEMAGAGLPKTGRIGFEIFDKTNFGITDFAEHVNYRRALEGELERSIMAISEVQQARVHVTLPKDSVFTDAQEPAKASVLVGLRPGTRLSAPNVIAITNLVSSAVEGLTPEAVSVVDMNGNLLSRPRRDGPLDGVETSEAALDYKQAFEHDLVLKINNTLEPLLGADKFRTGVSADIDMTSGEQSEETFDPSKSVMVSSQKTEDTSTSSRVSPAIPGTASNLPNLQAAAPPAAPAAQTPPTTPAQPNGQAPAQTAQTAKAQAPEAPSRVGGNTTGSNRRSESITYQTSRVTRHTKLPQGTVKRLSIAVLVDQGFKWEGQGKQMHRVILPPDPDKLKAIQALVGTLVGLDAQRGDQLTVEALPFDASLDAEPPGDAVPAAQKKLEDPLSLDALRKRPAVLYGSIGGAVLVLALVIFALTRGGKQRATLEAREALPVPVTSTAALNAIPSAPPAAGEAPRLPALMPSRTEVLLTQLQESGKANPEAWANILRTWLSEGDAV